MHACSYRNCSCACLGICTLRVRENWNNVLCIVGHCIIDSKSVDCTELCLYYPLVASARALYTLRQDSITKLGRGHVPELQGRKKYTALPQYRMSNLVKLTTTVPVPTVTEYTSPVPLAGIGQGLRTPNQIWYIHSHRILFFSHLDIIAHTLELHIV